MAIKVRIPTPLRKLTGGQGEVEAVGNTIMEVLDHLESRYPGLRERLLDETGNLRRFINVYLNDEDIRFLKGQDTIVKDSDEISIIPAIAGGMSGLKIRLTYPESQITEPIVYRIGHEFRLITNIRRANIEERSGWAILELIGDTAEIDRAIAWLRGKGIQVDPVEGTVLE
ncbi:MAG: MoaD/ThiS family protein [Nitrospirae bacterium]|nr:MoaD/ThiS family protein [Nitrospirota bacterium]